MLEKQSSFLLVLAEALDGGVVLEGALVGGVVVVVAHVGVVELERGPGDGPFWQKQAVESVVQAKGPVQFHICISFNKKKSATLQCMCYSCNKT